jgi:branched-subunit amino acid transport protein
MLRASSGLGYFRTHWRFLAQTATWILAIFAGFLLPPPEWPGLWEALGRFVVATLSGALFVPIVLFARKQYTWQWWGAAATSLIVGVAIVFVYIDRRNDDWTTTYSKERVVVGSTLTGEGKRFIDEQVLLGRPPPDAHALIMAFQGKAKDIWMPAEVDSRRRALIGMYLGSLLFLTSGLLCVLQAMHCASGRR